MKEEPTVEMSDEFGERLARVVATLARFVADNSPALRSAVAAYERWGVNAAEEHANGGRPQ